MFESLQDVIDFYKDDPETHRVIWEEFKKNVNACSPLKKHRDYIVSTRSGYGNRSLHWLWKLLVDKMPNVFTFVEIGVYMGQTVSLVRLIAGMNSQVPRIYGVTPLAPSGDKYSKHPQIDYETAIVRVHLEQNIPMDCLNVIEGLSQDKPIIETVRSLSPIDLLYIDGCHDYDVVVSDIQQYSPMLAVGGFLIIDDASSYLKMPKGMIRMDWFGLPDVSNAVRDTVEKDSRFEHQFAVGHNRIWKRVR